MNIVFGYHSAIECWQAYGQREWLASMRPTQVRSVAVGYESSELESFIEQHPELVLPLHVLVPDADKRKNNKRLACHVCSGPLPVGSFWRIDKNCLVACPELTYLQMASQLPLIKLIELGMELCGTYQPSLEEGGGMLQRCGSLTTSNKLRRFVERMKHEYGSRKALTALEWVGHGSASPMETFLWMRLCLPVRLGGRGFKPALLNHPVELNAKGKAATGKETLRCDLFFPEHRVAVEYDSTAYHNSSDRIASDSIRRGALECQGIKVVTITRQEFFIFEEFEGKVRQIARLMGRRLRAPDAKQMQRRKELRDCLLLSGLMRYRTDAER